jgi:DNA-binding winged helix-turn-helix (wHTH) protein
MEADRRVTFEGFCLDLAPSSSVRGRGGRSHPKAFTVLRRLVEDGGQLVTKKELLRAGWAKTHVSDGVLKVSILEIRRALGDDPAAPRFIETVPRRGYRFVAPAPVGKEARRAPSVLVGRDGLLAQLEQRLARARAGERQMVFLSGEAGIGKTTVLEAFLTRAAPIRIVDRARRVSGALRGGGGVSAGARSARADCCASPGRKGDAAV